MIVAHGLSKSFGHFLAVDSVEFEIPRGEVVGFLGPNGAGKTTTIRMIAGYLPPTAGTLTVGGHDVRTESLAVRRLIGYLPESAPLYTEMRVSEYLGFRARLFGLRRAERAAAIGRVVEDCRLEAVRTRPIGQISKGYRQRVGLAAALLHAPPVIILDEPTVGLDPTQIREVRRLVRDLAGRHTIVFSSHILPEVEVVCDRILMIARGRIRAAGTIDELRGAAAGHRRYIVETRGDGAAAVLRGLEGVAEATGDAIGDDWRRLTVVAAPTARDLREPIAGALAGIGAPVRELREDAPSLEHLFVRMAAEAEIDHARRREAEAVA